MTQSTLSHVRRLIRAAVALAVAGALLADGATTSRGRGSSRRRTQRAPPRQPHQSISEALYTLLFLMAALILPLLAYFAYVIAMDPVTPHLVRDLSEYGKERAFGFLGGVGVRFKRGGGADSEPLKKSA